MRKNLANLLLKEMKSNEDIYLNHEKIPVNILGGGRDRDYGHLGFSHWADDDRAIMKTFTNIKTYHPNNIDELESNFKLIINSKVPTYLNLKK